VADDRRDQGLRRVADVADAQRRALADQVLDEEVPLLRELRPHVRIPRANEAGRAVERLEPLEAGRDRAGAARRVVADLRLEEERRVERQTQVRARALHVLRDAVAAAHDPALARTIREAEARLPAA